MDLCMFDSLESTNKYCELLDMNEVKEFTVICAREQTAGIGQRGNCWHAEAGSNLTFSMVLKPEFLPVENQYMLTKAVSLGLVEGIEPYLPNTTVRIKWPNDIYVGNKKICGILISNKVKGANLSVSIVGIGLNVNQTVFPDWVPNPVSIKQVSGRDESLEVVLKRVVDAVELRYIQLRDGWFSGVGEMDKEYLSRLLFLGREMPYKYHEKEIMATIVGVNRFGHLELVTDSGDTITCQLKELKFLGV